MALIDLADLAAFAEIEDSQAAAMIADAVAIAALVAPCLGDEVSLTVEQRAAARAVLRGAILRWHDTGTGAFQSQTAGPFGVQVDTRQQRRSMFWPSEITQLQTVCSGGVTSGAFTVDTATFMTTWDPVRDWLAADSE